MESNCVLHSYVLEFTNQGKIELDCLEIASKNSLSSILLAALESISPVMDYGSTNESRTMVENCI